MDGAERGKPKPTGIRGVLRNSGGTTSRFFSKSLGVRDSDEAELLGIGRAWSLWGSFGQGKLIIEGDPEIATKWLHVVSILLGNWFQ